MDGLAGLVFWLIVYFGAEYPPLVVNNLYPDPSPQSSQLAFLLILPLRVLSCLSEIIFRIYVYFKITNLSNVLINSSTIAILILTYVVGLVSGVVFVFEFNVSLLIPYTVSLLLRSFLIPANIVLSHDNISQIFVDSVKDFLDDFTAKIMNVWRVTWIFLKSLKNLFNSNQVSPEEIEEGT